MGLFDQFPYTNFHELNLMWILEALKEIKTTTEQFVAINSLKYADPIQWNITSQYEKNTIVIDPQTGTAYISVQPVPTGVALTNEDYWTVVFDLGSFVTRAAKNFTTRWEEDTTLTATFNSVAGDWLVWGDTLYIANVNITAGDSYIVDGNIRRITIEEVKNEIYTTFNTMIGDLADLSTTDKSNLVAAINEVMADTAGKVGDLADLETTDKTNVVAAVNEIYNIIENLDAGIAVSADKYGAVHDGVTDDSDAINAALAANRYVYLENGTYYIGKPIILNDLNVLFGITKGVVRLIYDPAINCIECGGNNYILNLLINTNNGENYAIHNANHSYINIFNVNILGGSFGSTSSRALKCEGDDWHTILLYNCLFDNGNTDGYSVEFYGNPLDTRTVNRDLHISYCFFDALHAASDHSGCVIIKDCWAAMMEFSLIRSNGGTYADAVCVDSTDPEAITDLWIASSDLRTGQLFIGDSCIVRNVNSYCSVIVSRGIYYRYEHKWIALQHTYGNFWTVIGDDTSVQRPTNGDLLVYQPTHTQTAHNLGGLVHTIGDTRWLYAHIIKSPNNRAGHRWAIGCRDTTTGQLEVFVGECYAEEMLKTATLADNVLTTTTKYIQQTRFAHNRYTDLHTISASWNGSAADINNIYVRCNYQAENNRLLWEVSCDNVRYIPMFQLNLPTGFTPDQWFIGFDDYNQPISGENASREYISIDMLTIS